jgi:hypothetical protein
MKQLLKCLVLAGMASMVVVGCSDDSPTTPTNNNTGDPTSVTFKANDKFTYDYYPHDVNDYRDNSGKQVKVWTVLGVNQSIGDRTGVAVVQEATFQADGVTPVGPPDTFDFHSGTDGKFSQYNLLQTVVKRIPGATSFLGEVPVKWVQIGDTKTATATTWDAIGGGPIVDTVSILGYNAQVTFAMNASHKGKQSVTVPSGTYANAFHTDHKVLIDVDADALNMHSKDTLNLSFDITPQLGIVRQSLSSRVFLAFSQQVPGFDMELVSVTHAQ